ncbi:MAG: YbhB/YbcL family Raf kinase inhibitor-like protein [Candidatus Kerfeldbacteria bacterium]|nr:YbhB/YbcL family Raf kinase inhibitor-like protein [Candidatus Kerfeldbacteria bacterium]
MMVQLTSPHFQANQTIPAQFTCAGEDISPALQWFNVPDTSKSFVLIVHDPDAPSKDWVHWLVKNIPATVTQVADDTVPTGGVEVANDFGRSSWGGPCPPRGEHHYYFEIYALDVTTIAGNSLAEIKTAMTGHILDQGELIGLFAR